MTCAQGQQMWILLGKLPLKLFKKPPETIIKVQLVEKKLRSLLWVSFTKIKPFKNYKGGFLSDLYELVLRNFDNSQKQRKKIIFKKD